jgi:hypothetical protein
MSAKTSVSYYQSVAVAVAAAVAVARLSRLWTDDGSSVLCHNRERSRLFE